MDGFLGGKQVKYLSIMVRAMIGWGWSGWAYLNREGWLEEKTQNNHLTESCSGRKKRLNWSQGKTRVGGWLSKQKGHETGKDLVYSKS